MRCPEEADLLQFALGAGSEANTVMLSRHLDDCISCQLRMAQLSETIDALRSADIHSDGTDLCLSAAALAALADSFDLQTDGAAAAHLTRCADCRARFVSLKAVLNDPDVHSEIALLERRGFLRKIRIFPAGFLAATAAAILAIVVLRPVDRVDSNSPAAVNSQHRDGVVTTAGASLIIAPIGQATLNDSLQWTSVPRADLYRITVWDRDGVVVWEGETRDTILALPAALERRQEMTYLWVVNARTDFDRWVSSESREFTIRLPRGGRQ